MHLCTRSHYSLLNGTMSVEELVQTAKKHNMSYLALTERHVLYSALEFQKQCDKYEIQAIFGLEITIDDEYDSIILAKNHRGFRALISASQHLLSNEILRLEDLLPWKSDIILILYAEQGPFETDLYQENYNNVHKKMQLFKENFDTLYIGISHEESSFFKKNNRVLQKIAAKLNVQSIALPKVYYKEPEDVDRLRILHAIDKGTFFDDNTLLSHPNRYFYSKEEMYDLYGKKLCEPLDEIAKMCHLDLKEHRTSLPKFQHGRNVDSKTFLSTLSSYGLKRRLSGKVTKEYQERLNYELKIINSMNFEDYFLIVYDIIRFAKQNDIYVGPGRGSSAGSLVAYSLGITDVDPIKFGLYFERFLNPSRASMPDIDIDFPDDKRSLVIDYARERYGDHHIAHIITFGTMKARQAFRDVSRVFQVPIYQVDQIAKLIQGHDLKYEYEHNHRFRRRIEESLLMQKVYMHASKIQGLPRHSSLHAAGIVLSDKPLADVAPYFIQEDGSSVLQYDMTLIETIGLIKIDFLGLRNLSIIDAISKDIPNFNLATLNYDDSLSFELLSKGETSGLFQLESSGMTSLLQSIQPREFMDLVDAIALYRPGPMENIPVYLKNRRDPHQIEYLNDDLKSITESSYGILIYQEQIMQVAQKMAGFSLAKADILRKAMSSKNMEEIQTLKQDFIQGALDKGYQMKDAVETFALIEKFANYGFNKSHSVAYAMIAYQMAYLKSHYPLMFYRYLLNSVMNSTPKTQSYIQELKTRDIKMKGVNLQISSYEYGLVHDCLVLPFNLCKGISRNTARKIEEERMINGKYNDYFEAIARLSLVGLSRHHFESLINGGAFDCFSCTRESYLEHLDLALNFSSLITLEKDGVKYLDWNLLSKPRMEKIEANHYYRLQRERKVLGFYFSNHPSERLQAKHQTNLLQDCQEKQKNYRVIAMLESFREHKTRKGDLMAFLKLSDKSGEKDAVIFPYLYQELKNTLEIGDIIYVQGRCDDKKALIINRLARFESQD